MEREKTSFCYRVQVPTLSIHGYLEPEDVTFGNGVSADISD